MHAEAITKGWDVALLILSMMPFLLSAGYCLSYLFQKQRVSSSN